MYAGELTAVSINHKCYQLSNCTHVLVIAHMCNQLVNDWVCMRVRLGTGVVCLVVQRGCGALGGCWLQLRCGMGHGALLWQSWQSQVQGPSGIGFLWQSSGISASGPCPSISTACGGKSMVWPQHHWIATEAGPSQIEAGQSSSSPCPMTKVEP